MRETKADNVTWHDANLSHEERESLLEQRGCVVWFTGFSGAGKSTLARAVEERLLRLKKVAYVLDGDNLRLGLNADLGFEASDRTENIRRVGHLAKLFADGGLVTLTAFISPSREDRAKARALFPEGRFLECYVATSLEACEARDPKGLYVRARAGEINNFTGISAPYEPPLNAEIVVQTEHQSIEDSANQVIHALRERGLLHG